MTTPHKTPTSIAVEALTVANMALAKLSEHERTCGLRWKGVHHELKLMREQTRAHSARWEKLAWLVVLSALAAFGAVIGELIF